MILKTAIKANFHPALTLGFLRLSSLNKVIAIWPRTPFQLRVKVYVDVLLELQVLLVNLLISKLPNLISRKLLSAFMLSTLDLPHISVRNIEF